MSEPVGEVIRVDVERRSKDQVVLHVVGDVDMTTAPELERRLRDELRGARTLVVDLLGVGFFGSPGLRVLVTARGLADASGCVLRVVANQNSVVRPVRITGLQGALELFPSVEDACADSV